MAKAANGVAPERRGGRGWEKGREVASFSPLQTWFCYVDIFCFAHTHTHKSTRTRRTRAVSLPRPVGIAQFGHIFCCPRYAPSFMVNNGVCLVGLDHAAARKNADKFLPLACSALLFLYPFLCRVLLCMGLFTTASALLCQCMRVI